MPSATLRRRPTGGARLVVTVTAPDGAVRTSRGLAAWLTKAAPAAARGEVTVALVSDGRMRTLNRSFRNKDYATDVLSFPTKPRLTAYAKATAVRRSFTRRRKPGPSLKGRAEITGGEGQGFSPGNLGDIVIATGVANRQADEAGHSVATELKVLALHGLMHLLGYDHERDDGEMARAEARLRKKAGLKEGLIQRGGAQASPSKRAGR